MKASQLRTCTEHDRSGQSFWAKRFASKQYADTFRSNIKISNQFILWFFNQVLITKTDCIMNSVDSLGDFAIPKSLLNDRIMREGN